MTTRAGTTTTDCGADDDDRAAEGSVPDAKPFSVKERAKCYNCSCIHVYVCTIARTRIAGVGSELEIPHQRLARSKLIDCIRERH